MAVLIIFATYSTFHKVASLNGIRRAFKLVAIPSIHIYSDRSLHRGEQKNCPQWGLKPGPLDLHANALPTELGRNLLGRRFLKWALFVSCTTLHVGLRSFLESIEHNFIKTHEDSGLQLNVDFAQLVRHWPEDPEVLVSNPTGAISDESFLLFPV